ncbi:DUF1146 family protein [Marinilactibacillus psychrotolerans]|uniref:DUF1146 domain-containing protein n=1 Tax=Marinilactibacillus psychrotolerans TaxID=191770 RepID=A0A511H1V8_9LACT|nr:DUF1146 family protein [Marinilactibacillus psychrotolerans]TLQ07201.1 DUF1146 domain-containing protein [Marinilactibacillus psychrotolerans]GEL67516.1 membrane protein [Marinilactibacillus psychrotolerans]GEQ36435.1 membrane protein [Marinilactibacillus psychrotolerans]SDC98286.1 conserved hypothetical integral membrane protein [Marinilactibacillus psychrotolerans]
MTFIGIQSLITIISHITFILITFWALQGLRTDSLIKKYHIQQAKILYIFLSIAIGYTVSSFFIDFILSSQNLVQLFG